MDSRVQRTDQAEKFLEALASAPLTWENVFRSPEYTDKTDKEVVDLLFVLRNKGIFVSMKCQQDPERRTGDKLVRWVQKSAKDALRQVGGGIRTSRTQEFWCNHPRRGQVSFKPEQIDPARAVVIVETLEEVALSQDIPLEVGGVPVSYLSVKDFSHLVIELRTIKDLLLYLDARCSIYPELQRTVGIEKAIFEFYVLYKGSSRGVDTLQDIVEEIGARKTEVEGLLKTRKAKNAQASLIERISNDLSVRSKKYAEGLDAEIVHLFDPTSDRSNYLLIQEELCDLVLDERRKLGAYLSEAIERVRSDNEPESMGCQAAHLDSKPDFLYVLSSSKGVSRNEVYKRCIDLIHGGLAWYGKARGLLVNYIQDRNNFETVLIPSFKESPEYIRLGEKHFSNRRMFDIPIDRV